MNTVFICTPSLFREFIISSCSLSISAVFFEPKKVLKCDYPTNLEGEFDLLSKYSCYKQNLNLDYYYIESINSEYLKNKISLIKDPFNIVLSGANKMSSKTLNDLKKNKSLRNILNIHFEIA